MEEFRALWINFPFFSLLVAVTTEKTPAIGQTPPRSSVSLSSALVRNGGRCWTLSYCLLVRSSAALCNQPTEMRPAEPSQPGSSGDKGDAHHRVAPSVAAAAAPSVSSLSQQPFRVGRLAFSQVNNNSQQQVNMMTASQDLNVALSGCSLNSQQQQQQQAPGVKAAAAAAPPPKWGETPKRQFQQQQRIAPVAPQHYDEPGFDPPLSQLAPQSQIDAYMLG